MFAVFYIYKLCDICDSKGGTFKYGLTTFETPVATLITLLRLGQGLWGFEREEEGCGRGRGCGSGSVASFSVYCAVLSFSLFLMCV